MVLAELRAVAFVEDEDDALVREWCEKLLVGFLVLASSLPVAFAVLVQREAELNYRRTIQTAFREVSDALIAYERLQEQRKEQALLVEALQETTRLSNARYRGGLDSYLQVLDAQRNLFDGELVLARLQLAELNSVVLLYRALGGGWQ